MRERRQGGHPVNDWMVSSLRSNLVVKPVTGFGNSNNALSPSAFPLWSFTVPSTDRLHFKKIEKDGSLLRKLWTFTHTHTHTYGWRTRQNLLDRSYFWSIFLNGLPSFNSWRKKNIFFYWLYIHAVITLSPSYPSFFFYT